MPFPAGPFIHAGDLSYPVRVEDADGVEQTWVYALDLEARRALRYVVKLEPGGFPALQTVDRCHMDEQGRAVWEGMEIASRCVDARGWRILDVDTGDELVRVPL